MQEHAIGAIIHPAQQFDAFRDGGSCSIQSQDDAHITPPILLIDTWKSFQCIVLLEEQRTHQTKSSKVFKIEGFESRIVLERGHDEKEILLDCYLDFIPALSDEKTQVTHSLAACSQCAYTGRQNMISSHPHPN
jgi:hypothetical protein